LDDQAARDVQWTREIDEALVRLQSSKSEVAGGEQKKQEGVISEQARSGVSEGPSYEEIQKRGYEIHVERGGRHGSDLEDWLEAGRELKAKYQAG
jgi:DUF2934 family protein